MYEAEIAKLVQDLGIEGISIEWQWVNRPHVKQTRRMTTWGTHQRLGNRHKIVVALLRERPAVIETIAHELRHAWQEHNGILQMGGKYQWKGTVHYSEAKTYSYRSKYWTRPHEVDARAYAADAVARLFSDVAKTAPIETPQRKMDKAFATFGW